MKRLPDAVFVADGVYDQKSLMEANKIWKKSFAILNTNGNIDLVDDFIPASTNAVKSVTFIAESLASSLPKASAKKAQVRKTPAKKTSGEQKRKAPAKKAEVKKETEKKEVERKAPTKKTTTKKTEEK
jgi:ribosomal protein S2